LSLFTLLVIENIELFSTFHLFCFANCQAKLYFTYIGLFNSALFASIYWVVLDVVSGLQAINIAEKIRSNMAKLLVPVAVDTTSKVSVTMAFFLK
jgi:hypothetical protein